RRPAALGETAPGVDSDAGLAHFAETVARTAPAPSGSAGPSSASSGTTAQTHANAEQSDDRSIGSAFRPDSGDGFGPVEYWVKLRMPTSQWWLSQQAATVATVPFLT